MVLPTRPHYTFTLIELLVVVAIIAILASMLLPALSRARDAVRSASCQNNLKQSALAVFTYADDYDGYPPIATGGNQRAWYQQVFLQVHPNININNTASRAPYRLPNTHLMTCPSDPDPTVYDIAYSYTANNAVCTWQNTNGTYYSPPMRIGAFKKPSQAYVGYDGWGLGGADAFNTSNWHFLGSAHSYWIASRQTALASGKLIVHSGKFNLVFIDGHVWSSLGPPTMESSILEGKPDIYWGEY